ncbi:hypothetical protein V501_00139 [Pseudogymnoascus sp. VKM F-4519 (FW-2642)]|nr:hypothetical protein V501_00139 [Pseudogymnoascus sp. VKM F-4519 (FW-2642)]
MPPTSRRRVFAVHIIYSTWFHLISKVPGPLLARHTEFWRTKRYFRGTWLEEVVKLHEEYGPVVRIALNEISFVFVNECGLKELYGHGKPSQKTQWYDTWVIPGMGDSFFAMTDRNIHRRLRSRVSGTYSMFAILGMEELITEVMDLNLNVLSKIAASGKPMRLD